jgi:outer membrane protein assembly factor BamB
VRRGVLALLGLLVLGGGAAAAWYYHDQTQTHEKRGSSTIEFVTTQPPATVAKRPPKVVHEVPWPMYGYDPQRTHEAGFKVRPPFSKLWTQRTGNVIEFPPSLGGGLLFVAQDRGRLFAIDTGSGEIRWRKRFGHCSAASPAVSTTTVYMAYMQPKPCTRYPRTQRGFVVAIRYRSGDKLLRRGQELWRYHTGAVESSPLLVKNTLYFGSWDHHVYALDVSKARPRLRWRFRADAEVNTSPAYGGGMVFVGTDAGGVYGLNARTGREVWRSTSFSRFGRREYFYASPTVAYGRVYIGNTDGTLYAFGARTGHLLWAQHAGSYIYTAAAVWRRLVIVGTYNGDLIAYDAATGDARWRHSAPSAIHGAPTVLDGIAYFSTCPVCGAHGSRSTKQGAAGTFGVDARNGRLVWRFGDGRYSPVVADPKRMYVAGYTRVYGFVPRRKAR